MASKEATIWIPAKFEPSFTSTNANVFCLRTVLTQPLTSMGPSVGRVASTAFTRGTIFVKDDDAVELATPTRWHRRIHCTGFEKAQADKTPPEGKIARHIEVAKQKSTL